MPKSTRKSLTKNEDYFKFLFVSKWRKNSKWKLKKNTFNQVHLTWIMAKRRVQTFPKFCIKLTSKGIWWIKRCHRRALFYLDQFIGAIYICSISIVCQVSNHVSKAEKCGFYNFFIRFTFFSVDSRRFIGHWTDFWGRLTFVKVIVRCFEIISYLISDTLSCRSLEDNDSVISELFNSLYFGYEILILFQLSTVPLKLIFIMQNLNTWKKYLNSSCEVV